MLHGSLTIDAAGSWTYEVDNDLPAVQSLGVGATLTDTVTVSSLDGTAQSIAITITGTNDAAFITGSVTGSVTEDVVDENGDLVASGQLALRMPMLVRRSSMRRRYRARMVL